MKQEWRIVANSFMQGFTGAGLFRKLDYPGAPTEFVDSRPVEEIIASSEFDEMLRKLQVHRDRDSSK